MTENESMSHVTLRSFNIDCYCTSADVQALVETRSSQAFKATWHVFEKPVVLLLNLQQHIQEGELMI